MSIIVENLEVNHSYDNEGISIAVINSGMFPAVYVLNGLVRHQMLDEDGDYDEQKIIDIFNRKFDIELNHSEISWGEVESVNIK